MKLVILTQYYPPEPGAPQARLGDLARRLTDAGHQVDVVTAMPNYPTGRIAEPWCGRVLGTEIIEGVAVHRSWIRARPGGRFLDTLGAYGSFATSAVLSAPLRIRRADIVLWESPPLFLAPVAWLLAHKLRARLVMNVSDLWPASVVDLGMLRPGRLLDFFEWWEKRAYDSADLITGQTDGILSGVGSISTTDQMLFPNGVDTTLFAPPKSPRQRTRTLTVGYAGNFGRSQALEQVVDAASLLVDEPVEFIVAGDGPMRGALIERADQLGLHNVRFSDIVRHAEVPALTAEWDLALVPLRDAAVFSGARPSKMFELAAMGLPFIFCGRGEGAEIARHLGARVVPPEHPAELAQAILHFAQTPREEREARARDGLRYVREHFDRRAIAVQMEQAFEALIESRPAVSNAAGSGTAKRLEARA